MLKRPLSLPEEGSDEPLINLTPLIDVVFIVLISFMLIAPVLDIDSITLAPSGPASKKESPSIQNSPLAISIRSDNSIWFQGAKMTLSQLEQSLRQEKKRHPHAIPQLIHDKQAAFGTYQSLKNMLESAGFAQMDVILKPG